MRSWNLTAKSTELHPNFVPQITGMKREIITTADGSHTVSIPDMQVTYHSHHGAVQESVHVFIEAGLRWWLANRAAPNNNPEQESAAEQPVRILEMGFGTGLNAYLTALEAEKLRIPVQYTAIEKFPLLADEATQLNYGAENRDLFSQLHQSNWEAEVPLSPYFTLSKRQTDLQLFSATDPYHIIYFDAFAPAAQPELWTEAIFTRLHSMLQHGGILVTYCSKGVVRRAMQAAGFLVTKIPGPPRKREMVRAIKNL